MSRRRPSFLAEAAGILLGLAASLAAQQLPTSDPALLLHADAQQRAAWATEWLSSEEPRRIAWGAWLARQDRQTVLIPALIGKVTEYQPTEESSWQTVGRDRHDALLVVLDTLIGLGAAVPVNEARKLFPEFAAQSVILLVRSPDDAQSALLDIFQNARANRTWLAAGNVLLKSRTPGFAALLLNRLTRHMVVSVVDSGFGSGGGVGVGDGCGFSSRGPKQGWPPVGLYLLDQFPERMPRLMATFLVGGETTVYYWRSEPGNYDNPPDFPGSCDDSNRDLYRAQYLNKLMELSSPRIKLDPYPQVNLSWKNETQYRQELIAAVEERRKEFRRVVAQLQESVRVLTPGEAATLQPRLEIVIRDERTDRSAPLPSILGDDRTVVVKSALTQPLD